ncbi:ENY2 transcription and export complex 2 subunit [Phyllostomus discolor]|uniref:ENY2 transcription and export complex 2 subunit n=1 Tax=Phyllostomus discolor TaxID=89673 RepID=A0A833ZLR2_9CHIR|nr:ENY2 transcription and export complex 2 subunit [Phyllostomus discolor]
MNKDAQMRAAINQKLIETGERERLKELLRAKLIECGWKDQLKAHCKGNQFPLEDTLIPLLSTVLVWGSLEKIQLVFYRYIKYSDIILNKWKINSCGNDFLFFVVICRANS